MASMVSSFWPMATLSPGLTSTVMMVPGNGALMAMLVVCVSVLGIFDSLRVGFGGSALTRVGVLVIFSSF